jgi:hypothetical protein
MTEKKKICKVYLVKESHFEDDCGLGGGGSFGDSKLLKAFFKKVDANNYLKGYKKNLLENLNSISSKIIPRWDTFTDDQKLWKFKFTIESLEVS